MSPEEILYWLKETDRVKLEELRSRADSMRRSTVGEEVHLRGLIEFSNLCSMHCLYCGIRKSNMEINRYCMSQAEIIEAVSIADDFGYGTIVLQGGNYDGLCAEKTGELIKTVKSRYSKAVALSLGERKLGEFSYWRRCGADRYLLKFETSDPSLDAALRPDNGTGYSIRIEMLKVLRRMGYETGSGVITGLPEQTYSSLAEDLALFRELDLDMIALGPFIPHPGTPLGRMFADGPDKSSEQVPNDEITALKCIAISRILCPEANIPSTSALGAVDYEGYARGLEWGANVIMCNVTPYRYRNLYEIYPNPNACWNVNQQHVWITDIIKGLGRKPGSGTGPRIRRISIMQGQSDSCELQNGLYRNCSSG